MYLEEINEIVDLNRVRWNTRNGITFYATYTKNAGTRNFLLQRANGFIDFAIDEYDLKNNREYRLFHLPDYISVVVAPC